MLLLEVEFTPVPAAPPLEAVLAEVQPPLPGMILLFVETGLFIELLLVEDDDVDDNAALAEADGEEVVEVVDVVLLLLLLLQVEVVVVAPVTAILPLLALL